MDYRKAKVGAKVRITKDIDQCAGGRIGFIRELRGYNRLGGQIFARYCGVWLEYEVPAQGGAPARMVHCNVQCSSEVLEIVK